MPQFCLPPYDSESDSEEETWLESEGTIRPPVVGIAVNGKGMDTVARNPSVVGFEANGSRMDAATISVHGDQSVNKFDSSLGWRQSSPVVGSKAVISSYQHPTVSNGSDSVWSGGSELQWKQWNNENCIAYVATLNTTLMQLNNSIQAQIETEREKLRQQHHQELQELKAFIERQHQQSKEIQELQMINNRSLDIQDSRDPQDKETERVVPTAKSSQTNEINNRTEVIQSAEVRTPVEGHKGDDTQPSATSTTEPQTELGLKVEKLLEQLNDLQTSIAPFDKIKGVSKRRLKMKRAICGKLNTLTDDVAKVHEVIEQVNDAFDSARQEDKQVKDEISAGKQDYTPDMALGETYLLNLLASNFMQRIQAHGFNGPRGDGFPLAATIAQVVLKNDKAIPVLEAHISKVCPIAVPLLPDEVAGKSEDELMESLGVQRDQNGKFESWDRFSSRTENIISVVAGIQASMPHSHKLLGGHQGAADWLELVLEALPATTPLPLLTAPILLGFLSGAGCMLANQHASIFRKCLQVVSADILGRLDQGDIGKPSFIRLSKILEDGFDGFKSKVPSKAIVELYLTNNSMNPTNEQPSSSASSTISASQPFPPSHCSQGVPKNPFGVATAAVTFAPSSAADQMEDEEMSDAFENLDNSFLSNANSNRTVNPFNNNHARVSTTPRTHPANQGFGFGCGYDQLRNPFESKHQSQTQLCFGQSQIRTVATPHLANLKPQNAAQLKPKSQNTKKAVPPCKFFARGNCRFGSKCRFSHETGNDAPKCSWGGLPENRSTNFLHSPFGVLSHPQKSIPRNLFA